MTETAYLDVELMERICCQLAAAVFDAEESPAPPFSPHTRELLELSLNAPKHAFGGRELYPSLVDKAAVLYYSLIQNHPFQNGNKRVATASLLIFLFINDHWLNVGAKELAEKTIELARSGEQKRDPKSLVENLKIWAQSHLAELKEDTPHNGQ